MPAFMIDDACSYLLALDTPGCAPLEVAALGALHGHSLTQATRRVSLLTATGLALPVGPGRVTITGLGREGARLRRVSGR